MTKSAGALSIGLLVVSVACAPAPPPDTRAQDEAAVRAADSGASNAAQAKDLEKFLSYYAADTTILPPNGPMITGTDGARKMFGEMLTMPGFGISWQTIKAEAARSGDLAYSVGAYNMTMTGPDGKLVADRGKYTTIWKKQADGSWKIAADMLNSDMPAMPAPPPSPGK